MRPKVMAQRRRRRKSEPLDLASIAAFCLCKPVELSYFHGHAFTCNMLSHAARHLFQKTGTET